MSFLEAFAAMFLKHLKVTDTFRKVDRILAPGEPSAGSEEIALV